MSGSRMRSSPKVPVLYQLVLQASVWRIPQGAEIISGARLWIGTAMHVVDGLRQFLNSAKVKTNGEACGPLMTNWWSHYLQTSAGLPLLGLRKPLRCHRGSVKVDRRLTGVAILATGEGLPVSSFPWLQR